MEGNDADEPLTLSTTASVLKELSGTKQEELERLSAELAAAKTRLAATAAEIPPLKSRIESTNGAVAERQAEAARKKAAAEELRRRVDLAGAELRRLCAEVAASRDAKDALERRVLVRRHAARALQLAERAVATETHALAWAAAAAAEQAGDVVGGTCGEDGQDHHDVVALPARKLEELRRRVEAEERKAAARVEEAEAMRRAAEASRAAAVARLDAARAKRREAAAAAENRRRDVDGNDAGKRAKRAPLPRRRSGRSCFSVKKLRSFFCPVGKA